MKKCKKVQVICNTFATHCIHGITKSLLLLWHSKKKRFLSCKWSALNLLWRAYQVICLRGLSCLHNDPRVEEKNRSGAYFPPVHEQPNLGKRVSVNLCHIAGLRIPIVPLIESFHFEKAFKRAENILHPAPVRTHLHLYAHTSQFSTRLLTPPHICTTSGN